MNIGDARYKMPDRAGLRDRLLEMRTLGLFETLDDEGATMLAEHARLMRFSAGMPVTGLNREIESVHVILEGSIRIGDSEGRGVTVGPGRPVGLIGVLAETTASPQSFAVEPTRTLEIQRDVFLDALEENFSLWRSALHLLAGTLIDARGELPPPATGPIADSPATTRPRTLVERALEISKAGIFTNTNVDAVFDLARVLREVHVPAGHVFWKQGDTPHTALRIASGAVLCTNAKGESIAGRDYILGAAAAFARRDHGYEARAQTDVTAFEFKVEDWLLVLEAHPELAMKVISNFATMLSVAFLKMRTENTLEK